jgi:hypothetical protein
VLVYDVNVEAGEDDGVVPVQGITVQLGILPLLPLDIKELESSRRDSMFSCVIFQAWLSPNRNRLQYGLL